ncbi:MAG: hypothetical protein HQK65_17715 [Desulfamplus sp.]|nr:hypothetical protein [Desulfamplus sp.]
MDTKTGRHAVLGNVADFPELNIRKLSRIAERWGNRLRQQGVSLLEIFLCRYAANPVYENIGLKYAIIFKIINYELPDCKKIAEERGKTLEETIFWQSILDPALSFIQNINYPKWLKDRDQSSSPSIFRTPPGELDFPPCLQESDFTEVYLHGAPVNWAHQWLMIPLFHWFEELPDQIRLDEGVISLWTLNPFDTSTQLPDINPSLGTMLSLSLHYCDLKERHDPSVEGIESLKDYIKLLDSEYNNLHESSAEEATRETPSTGLDFGELEKQFHSFLKNICPEIEDFWNSISDEIDIGDYEFSSWKEGKPDQRRKVAVHLYNQRHYTYLLLPYIDHSEPYKINSRAKRKFVVEVLKEALRTDEKLKPIWENKKIKTNTDALIDQHNSLILHNN